VAGRDAGVRVEGLREFRRELKRVSPAVDRELARELKRGGQAIADDASARAPRRTGKYASSIRVYAARGGVAVGSRLPQAGVLHWGGTIRPRGVPITFRARPVVLEAAERHMGRIVDDVGDAVETAARRAGWR
jgi:hypothetical protein